MALPKFSEISDNKILIDSCVLIYCGDAVLGEQTKTILRSLEDSDNRLAISEMCVFEVLKHRLDSDNFDYFSTLLRYLDNISLHMPALTNAAKLGQLYKDGKKSPEDIREESKKGAHTGDMLIGGTAIFHNALILTADKSEGFNWRFWEPIAHEYIMYEHSHQTRVIDLYLLKFKLQDSLPDGFLTTETHDGGPVSLSQVRGQLELPIID